MNAASAATAMMVQMLLARWLGEVEYGLFAYALSWLTFFTMMAVAGWDSTSLRFVGAYAGNRQSVLLKSYVAFAQRRVALFSIVLSLTAALGLLLAHSKLGSGQFAVFLIACGLLPWNALAQLHASILQGFKRVVWSSSVQGLLRPLLMVAAVAVAPALFGSTPDAVSVMSAQWLVALPVPFVLVLLWRGFVPKAEKSNHDATSHPEWRQVSRGMFAMTGSQYLLSQSDILLVGMMLGTTQAGIYAVASRLASLVTFGITSLNSVLAPTIADLHVRGEHQALQRTVTLSSWYVVAYTIPVILVLAVSGRWLLGLFGAGFVEGYVVTLLLAVGQFVVAMAGSVGFLLTMTGHQKDAATVVASTSVLAILLVAILTPRFGLPGAACGTLLATAARSGILCLLVKRRLNISTFAFHPWLSASRTSSNRN